jgi:DNA polymerase-3 subunit epsilon
VTTLVRQAIPWWQGPILGVDFETTGVNVRTDRIVQACLAATMTGHEPNVMAEYINPGIPIPREASFVHGISDDHVQQFGNPAVEAVERIADALADAVKARIPIGGMNLAYDLTMLRHECRRYGMLTVEERAGTVLAPVIDAYVLDKYVDPYRKGKRQLGPLAERYGVMLSNAHDAVADTIASVEVARRIGQLYSEVGGMGLFRLHACQADWRAEQAAGLQEYFRRKGERTAVVDPCWPYCADDTHELGG